MRTFCAALMSCCSFFVGTLGAQTPAAAPASIANAVPLGVRVPVANPGVMDTAQAAVIYGQNQRKSVRLESGTSRQIALQAGETVRVIIALPIAQAGDLVDVTPVDGGSVDAPLDGLPVTSGGIASFLFKVRPEPGVYRVWLNEGNNRYVFEFCVLDPNNPVPGRNMIVAY